MKSLRAFKIGEVEVTPPILLAPLAGYTDSPFRRIVKEFGCGLVYTEMISSEGILYKDKKSLELLKYNEEERPIAAQIFGSNETHLEYSAKYLEDYGFDIIDINAGCPTPKIVKGNSGAALLSDLKLLKKIVSRITNAVKIPVTLKVRKGFRKGENVLKEVLKISEGEGISALTIHGITAEEGFRKDCEDWDSIGEISSIAKIPIVGNGGIEKEEDAVKLLNITGVKGIMIGRAAIRKPWFIKSCVNFYEKNSPFNILINDKLNIILRHIRMEIEEKGEERAIVEMRKFLAQYVSGMRNASYIRYKINRINKLNELESLLKAFFVCEEEL